MKPSSLNVSSGQCQAPGAESGGEQSLYHVLQANKAAKQAAFEEAAKLSNQFRPLDDDEIEFLDDVRAKQRNEEERVKRETEEGLRAFRERQKTGASGDGIVPVASSLEPTTADVEREGGGKGDGEGEEWTVGGRKRKRAKEREVVKGLKRKTSEGGGGESLGARVYDEKKKEGPGDAEVTSISKTAGEDEKSKRPQGQQEVKKQESKGLGLVDYGSDDSDDD